MERWRGRVAVVTGASGGVGAAVAYQLQDAGVNVVALARKEGKIQEGIEEARKDAKARGKVVIGKAEAPGTLYCLKCDVCNEQEIYNAFHWIRDTLGVIHILVNNAGVGGTTKLNETNTSEWREILETNVLGLCLCTREALKLMKENDVKDGHIIHIGSKAGHRVINLPGIHVYSASKHAVRVLAEGLRRELAAAKTRIRVTEVSPGAVMTDFVKERPPSADALAALGVTKPEELWNKVPHLKPEDVADAVLYAISTPRHVEIHEMIINVVGESF